LENGNWMSRSSHAGMLFSSGSSLNASSLDLVMILVIEFLRRFKIVSTDSIGLGWFGPMCRRTRTIFRTCFTWAFRDRRSFETHASG
jgi:hypothetical protein